MPKWKFIDIYLQPLCKAIDSNIAFLTPVMCGVDDVGQVIISYRNDLIKRVNVEGDSLQAIAKDVLSRI